MVFVMVFADDFSMSKKQAFNYLDRHEAFKFVRNHYDVIHTLDFDYAIEDVQQVAPYCPAQLVLVDQAETPMHDMRLWAEKFLKSEEA